MGLAISEPSPGSKGLSAGATTPVHDASNPNLGAKGTDPRATIIRSSAFVDARVQLSAKYGSIQWVKMAEYPVTRHLVTD